MPWQEKFHTLGLPNLVNTEEDAQPVLNFR